MTLNLKRIKQTTYLLSVIASLVAHTFNSIEFLGLKLYYIPIAIAFILSFTIKFKFDKVDKLIFIICILTLLSSFISIDEESISRSFNFIVILISVQKIRYLKLNVFFSICNYLTFFVCICLFYKYIHESSYRFQGFYNDPNYLVLTLITYLYISIVIILKNQDKLSIIVSSVNILFIVLLVFLTLSRTGIFCTFLIITISFYNYLKKHFYKGILLLCTLLIFGFPYISDRFSNTLENLNERIFKGGNDGTNRATSYRWKLTKSGLIYLTMHPENAILGIGIGSTGYYNKNGYYNETNVLTHNTKHGDHNSYTGLLVEQGIISFIIFILIVYSFIINNEKQKQSSLKNLNRIVLLSILIFGVSIKVTLYLPFWIILFLTYDYRNY